METKACKATLQSLIITLELGLSDIFGKSAKKTEMPNQNMLPVNSNKVPRAGARAFQKNGWHLIRGFDNAAVLFTSTSDSILDPYFFENACTIESSFWAISQNPLLVFLTT